ncbi:MAG: alanine racemase [Gemmatimonadales bacterium]|nr:alanine racemase [Gemmatimonadales bacterium]
MRPESNLTDPARTWIEVDLGALVSNAKTVATRAAGARLLPMVKANAYGLGAAPVARALESLDPWGYGVATPEEGAELRAAGITRRIVVFTPVTEALADVAKHDLTPALDGVAQVRAWRALAGDQPFHVQVDTGMGRGGIWWEAFAERSREFSDAAGLEGVFTHFHSAQSDPASVKEQWQRFQGALASLPRRPAIVHAANSAAALGFPEVAADLVRPGIFLYGGLAGVQRPQPVVTWRARVSGVEWREAGMTVSYGATFTARTRISLSAIAAGYADGVDHKLSNVGAVLISGRRLPIAGRVTMDTTMAWSGEWAPEEGAVAILIGKDGEEEITLDEMATAAGTISYEVLTRIGARVERRYR